MKRILMMIILLLVVGCAEKGTEIDTISIDMDKPDADVEVSEEVVSPPQEDEVVGSTEELEEVLDELVDEVPEEDDVNPDIPKEVSDLMTKSEGMTGYSYYYDNDQYFYKNNRIHIIYDDNRGVLDDNTLYNHLLIDRNEKKAFAWCVLTETFCGPNKEEIYWQVDYEDVLLPTERLRTLKNAEIVNADTSCESRKSCMEIEFVEDGMKKSMWIYTYNPLVYKVQWYDTAKGKEFTELYQNSVFNVQNDDVSVPSGYRLVIKK